MAAAVLMPAAAQANLIANGDFEAATTLTNASLTAATYGQWLAGTSWAVVDGTDNNFAQYGGAATDLLVQGALLPTTSCVGAGWKVKLSFAYQLPEAAEGAPPAAGQAQIAGLNPGGAWNLDGSFVNPTDGQILGTFTDMTETDPAAWGTYKNAITLPGAFEALGVGFNLPMVDNVIAEVVAPVSFKISPTTLNLKSRGKWVTAFISKPPSCYTLDSINADSILLSVGESSIPADWINRHGRKFLLKFDRQALIAMLNGATGAITLTVSGSFTDGIAFEGQTTLRVIDPGKKKAPKGGK